MATPHRHGILHRERKLVGTAEHAGNFSTLVSAIRTAGLESALDGAGPFTMFAPTDAAFRKLPAGSMEGLMNDRGRLTSFLKSHVVPGTIMAKDSFSTKNVKTLEGRDINFDTCDEFKVNGAKVVMPDIECRNGVLHGVDTVLIPVEPPARAAAAAAPEKCAPRETTRAAVAPAPVREKVVEKEHAHTATCGCGEQFTAPTAAEAERKLAEHTPKCGAAKPIAKESAVREKVVEKPVAKTVAPAAGHAHTATCGCGQEFTAPTQAEAERKLAAHAPKCGAAKEVVKEKVVEKPAAAAPAVKPAAAQKCTTKETVVKERVVERPREKTVTKQVMSSDRPIAQCTTCGQEVVGSTAEETKRKLVEHERIHKEAAAKPKAEPTRVEKNVSSCSTCGERFSGSTMEESRQNLEEHERTSHRGTIRGTLHEGAERIREGARDTRDYGSKSYESGRTGAAVGGAAGAVGAGAGAVAGGARGLLERASDAIRGRSGQYSVKCPECGEEITGSTREETQANLQEHGKVHLR